MSSYRPYPAYKDSDAEWLEKIPAHWSRGSVKHRFNSQLGKMLQPKAAAKTDREYPYLKALHTQWKGVAVDNLPSMWSTPLQASTYEVMNGDLLVCEGGEAGRCAIVQGLSRQTIIQNSVHRVRAKADNDVRFLKYNLHVAASSGWLNVLCNKATIVHFTSDKLDALNCPFPPLPEQKAIAAFLDRETARIDALIDKKQRLIELLKEKRQALITRAVTRGLDPDVPLKDSGVEWLGQVPAHWRLTKLQHLGKISSGATPSKANDRYWEGNIPWVSPKDMKWRDINDSIDHISDAAVSETGLALIPAGSILFVVRGMILAHTFPVAQNKVSVTINQDMKALRITSGSNSEFITELLLGLNDSILTILIDVAAHGTLALRMDSWKEFPLPMPPVSEQKIIADYINTLRNNAAQLEAAISQSINLLKERRAALITAAVTGQIDVREPCHEAA